MRRGRDSALALSGMKRCACLMVGVILLAAGPAWAWDVEVYIDRLEDYFYIDSFSGSPTWTTVREGVYADSGMGSIPINRITQSWDGNAWPSATMQDIESSSGVTAEANLEHYDGTTDEFFDYADAYVFGDIAPGEAFGAAWFYEFALTVDPFSFANVMLDGNGANGYIESQAGDAGAGFAQIKLYSHDVGLDDPGGANDPYDRESFFLVAPPIGGMVDSPMSLSYQFTNNGSTPVTYNLRLEGSALVFEDVPEPTSLALLGIGGLGLLARRRPRRRRAA